MIVFAIIIAVLFAFAMLRFGVKIEYSDTGLFVAAKVGPISKRIVPLPDKRLKKKKKKAKIKAKTKSAKQKEIITQSDEKKRKLIEKSAKDKKKLPGDFEKFLEIFKAAKSSLRRFRRRLLIKQITLHYEAAGGDPSKTAMAFGAANAFFGVITPVLENNFRIRKRSFTSGADFESEKQKVYLKAILSIALWELIYTALTMLPLLKIVIQKRKDDKADGKAPD